MIPIEYYWIALAGIAVAGVLGFLYGVLEKILE